MEVLRHIVSWGIVVFILFIPVVQVWEIYHKIKCRKVQSCTNRKCKYWIWCSHNDIEREKDELELRKQVMMDKLGLTEDDLNKK